MLRSLIHYWRLSLSVAAGAAVATTVLAGALLVGTSVRGSLRMLTLERLGGIDHALVADRFVPEDLADRLAGHPAVAERFSRVVPAILLRGGALHAERRTRASQVGLQGVDDRFLGLFPDAPTPPFPDRAAVLPPALINAALADELGAAPGDDLLLSLKRWSAVPRTSLLGRRETGDVVERLRVEVVAILPDRGLGRFGLATHQSTPFNVYLPLAALQRELDQEGAVNALLVSQRQAPGDEGDATALTAALWSVLRPDELGLQVEPRGSTLSIESDELVLRPPLAAAVLAAAEALGAGALPVSTYLANALTHGDRTVPYSTVTALDPPADTSLGELLSSTGGPAPDPGADGILLNSWTAEELDAGPGDSVALTYYAVGAREALREETVQLRVAGVVAMQGLAADPRLTQAYPGISDADSIAEWDPPFPIRLDRIRVADEEYWDRFGATPKAFLSLATGRRLWRTPWGDLTAVRLAPAPGSRLAELEEGLRREVMAELPAATFGLELIPVKRRGLDAASGATDFSQLFLAFSLFLIAAAALLVALLFRLGVERRAAEIGLLRAVGYPATAIRRRLLSEGGLLAAGGAVAGLGGATVYAATMIHGLRTWWQPAVGTPHLELHLTPAALGAGWAVAVGAVLLTIGWTLRMLRRVRPTALLAHRVETREIRVGGATRALAVGGLGAATLLLAVAFLTSRTESPTLFFIIGPALLCGLLAAFSWLSSGRRDRALAPSGRAALLRMAAGNSARHRGRSLLSVTLVATATFVIVAVAAYRHDIAGEELGLHSGTGGFTIVAESEVPLYTDLGGAMSEGWLELAPDDAAAVAAAEVIALPLVPGDDTSCLNLYQPRRPRLLGASERLIRRGGFAFRDTLDGRDHPWTLLDEDLGEGVIPAIGDAESTQWILKLGLGEELTLEDELGGQVRLRLVATLATSIFQSELLIPESALRRHFPSQDGFRILLVETGPDAIEDTVEALESGLEPYGVDATVAAERLAAFSAVANTYLSTFQTLGGLGLILGTLGLGIVTFRNVIERRRELAALRAFGFRRRLILWLVLVENALLLVVGLVVGAGAALVTTAPHLLSEAADVAWGLLAATLALVLLIGLAACAASAAVALRAPLLPALRAEP